MSLDTEFDFWPDERLATLVSCLSRTREGKESPPLDPRDSLPDLEDISFWTTVVEECNLLSDSDLEREEREEQLDMMAQELASAVHSELGGRTYNAVRPGLYLGDLSGPESRLTMLWLGVRGVLTVASHNIERLWMTDGIEYHTAIVDASAESVGPVLPASCAFLERCSPAFVCCASGQGLSLLEKQRAYKCPKFVCAAHLATSGRGRGLAFSETPSEMLRQLAAMCDVFSPFPAAEREALTAFCASRPVPDPDDEVPPSTPVTKPVPGTKLSAIDLVKVACSGRKRSRSEDEEDEEDEQMRSSDLTPQAKQARPRMTEGAGLKPKFVGDRSLDTVIGGDAGTIDAW